MLNVILFFLLCTMVTPRKIQDGVCVVCKQTVKKGEARHINSAAGQKKNLSRLLLKYGELDIIEGVMCRKCEKRIITIDVNVSEFQKMCHQNLNILTSKRGLTDITNTADTSYKRHASRKTLFSLSETFEVSTEDINKMDNNGNLLDECTLIPDHVPLNVQFQTPVVVRKKPTMTSTPAVTDFTIQSPTVSPVTCSVNQQTPLKPDSKKENGDHAYVARDTCKSQENKKKAKSIRSRLSKEHDASLNIISDSVQARDCDDFITNSEMSEILALLPLRSRKEFVDSILKNENMKAAVEDAIIADTSQNCDFLKNRKHGKVSVLMTKDFTELKKFNWDEILEELKSQHPFLLRLLMTILVPESLKEDKKLNRAAGNIPRLGMVYAILAQGRNSSLSKVQRVLSTVLFDHICDQKVNITCIVPILTSEGLNIVQVYLTVACGTLYM